MTANGRGRALKKDKTRKSSTGTTTQEAQPQEEIGYKLNDRQELFCHEYLKDRNATRAYIRAGYSEATAEACAPRLLGNAWIRARVNELIKEQLDKMKIEINFVIRQLLNSATIDIADAYDENGNLKPISEMPEPLRLAIISVETEELFDGRGDDREHIGTAKTIKIQDRLRALELLGKHLKMFTDVHEIPGLEGLAEEIKAARKRADQCRKSVK
jgi:phage terminase small subunit